MRDRAQAALPADEFAAMVTIIEKALDSKQASDRAIALSNIESIAERAAALNALPLRGDVSGCGRKLHNIRQGRLGPSMRDEALAIVRRVVGTAPERAAVLQHLEASIEQSVARHTDAQNNAIARPGKRLLSSMNPALPLGSNMIPGQQHGGGVGAEAEEVEAAAAHAQHNGAAMPVDPATGLPYGAAQAVPYPNGQWPAQAHGAHHPPIEPAALLYY